MANLKLDDWKKNDPLTADHFQQPVDIIREHLPINYGEGMQGITKYGSGTTISVTPNIAGKQNPILGYITSTGLYKFKDKDGTELTATTADYRYWVRFANNTPANDAAKKEDGLLKLDKYTGNRNILPAYYLPELRSHTHCLVDDMPVLIYPQYIDTTGGKLRWIIEPLLPIVGKISSPAMITANIWEYTVTVSLGFYAAGSNTIKCRNIQEIGNTATMTSFGLAMNPSSTTCGDITSLNPVSGYVTICGFDNESNKANFADITDMTKKAFALFKSDNLVNQVPA